MWRRIFILLVCILISKQAYLQEPDDSAAISQSKISFEVLSRSYTRVGKFHTVTIRAVKDNRNMDSSLICLRPSGTSLNWATKKGLTDINGIAKITIPPFENTGQYSLNISSDSILTDFIQAHTSIRVRKRKWVFVLISSLLGGLSLFLYGMHMLSNALQNTAGSRMRQILEKLTNNRFMAAGLGALITTIIQSSSATNVMLVSFVNSRLMQFRQSIGIILGAAIGTTITAQIIAFKLTDYALVFVTIGLILFLVFKQPNIKEIAKSILGFGILFFGMHIMSEAMYPLRTFQPFIDIITSLENPLFGILVGTVFTALIQSSSAFIGILIVLAMQSLLSFQASVALIIGANIGTSITAILASINTSREARQVAFAHTLIKTLGAGVILIFYPLFISLIHLIPVDDSTQSTAASPRLIAHIHTLFNVILFLLFIPFTHKLACLVNKIYPLREEDTKTFKPSYIHESLLNTPEAALISARKEVLLMMREVKLMFETILIPFQDRSANAITLINKSEENVNNWRDEISDFLIQLSRGERSQEQIQEIFILLNANKEFEQIADTISGPLVSKAESWCCAKYNFSPEGWSEIDAYHQATLKIIQKAIKTYSDFDLKKARKLKIKYDAYREEYFELERNHYKRLEQNIESTISSSKTHLELITLFRVISSHATNTARTIIQRKQNK